jgi:hypothetical protein
MYSISDARMTDWIKKDDENKAIPDGACVLNNSFLGLDRNKGVPYIINSNKPNNKPYGMKNYL